MARLVNILPRLLRRSHNSKRRSMQESNLGPKRKMRQTLIAARSLQDTFMRHTGEQLTRQQVVLRLVSTVTHAILPQVALCGLYGLTVASLNHFGYLGVIQEFKALPNVTVALNLALSLLLVFRTNAAYDRYWEGRKLWGAMVNTVRNLARGIWIMIEGRHPADYKQKQDAMRLASAFAVAMKLHLRRDPITLDDELATLMSPLQYQRIQQTSHGPLEISLWLADFLQYQYERKHINVFQLQDLHKLLNDMVDILGGCERILRTPVPLVYTITLKLLLVSYFIVVPLGMVESLHWWLVPVVTFLGLVFLSIHEMSSEIEEPFGHDPVTSHWILSATPLSEM